MTDKCTLTKLKVDYQAGLLEDYAVLLEQGGSVVEDDAAQMVIDLRQSAIMIRRLFNHEAVDAVKFYGSEFYCLSNFSAFRLTWRGMDFDTSEAAYHWEKFSRTSAPTADAIYAARSAHEAFKIAEQNAEKRRPDWMTVRVGIMKQILIAKTDEHEYVRRKLRETGVRELIEDSWRDPFWGWGCERDGENMLGKLWMEVRKGLCK